jgi:hypothetical protein
MVKPVIPLPAEGPRETGFSPLNRETHLVLCLTGNGLNGLNGLTL